MERQREDVRALACRLRVDLGEVFEDNDVAAFTVRKVSIAWGRALAASDSDGWRSLIVSGRFADYLRTGHREPRTS